MFVHQINHWTVQVFPAVSIYPSMTTEPNRWRTWAIGVVYNERRQVNFTKTNKYYRKPTIEKHYRNKKKMADNGKQWPYCYSSDNSSDYSTYSYGGASNSSNGSTFSYLSTESTYGTFGTWTGKDTNGYEADTESLSSTK